MIAVLSSSCVDVDVRGSSQALEASGASSPLSTQDAWAELGTVAFDRAAFTAGRAATATDVPDGIPVRYTAGGLPRSILGPGFRVPASAYGAAASSTPREAADAFVHRYAALWGATGADFDMGTVRVHHHDSPLGVDVDRVSYAQVHEGYSVVGAEISVLLDSGTKNVIGVTGTFLPVVDAETVARVTAERAVAAAGYGGEARGLVYWSGLLDGTESSPRLAWNVVGSDPDGAREDVYIDAEDERRLGVSTTSLHFLRRALTDARDLSGYQANTCQKWSYLYQPYPDVLDGCLRSACVACAADKQQCARCVCQRTDPPPPEPVDCETTLWQYDDLSGGCVANGDPAGEPSCDSEALQLWNDASNAYNYWESTFGRDGWNGAGGWLMLRANIDTLNYAGMAQPRYVGSSADTDYSFAQVSIADGAAGAWLDGHELGHALQFGTYAFNALASFYGQTVDILENHADVHAYRYQGLSTGPGACATYDYVHYNQYRAVPDLQTNKLIGDCHDWLLSRVGAPFTYHGVTVTPVADSVFDQVWYRALDVYLTGGDDYFDWWNDQVAAAADLYGTGSATYASFVEARDAIGGWTPNTTLLSTAGGSLGGVYTLSDRIAAVGHTASSARSPCIFFRYGTGIKWSCRESTGWTLTALLNTSADPAASEPAAAFRWEGGKYMIYVLWTGTDSRIHYRTLDTSTYTVGPASDMGALNLATGAVAAAPIYESASTDRLMVMYHPAAHASWFYSSHIGYAGAATDMGPTFDSSIAPALVAFPYYSRVYFMRPDSITAHNIRYTSYTLASGWDFTATSISDMYAGFSGIPAGVVASDYPVALAEFQRGSTGHMRMMFTTTTGTPGGRRELWYTTLKEAGPGILIGELFPLYRPVPMAVAGPYMMESPGGLTADAAGTALWNFWGSEKISGWRSFSD